MTTPSASQLSLLPSDERPGRTLDRQANHGEVFTRRWVVEFILDLVGYSAEEDLASLIVVEPACGSGAFLVPIVDRLVASAQRHDRHLEAARGAIRAFDVVPRNAEAARVAVAKRLAWHGVDSGLSEELATGWVTNDDFLLHDHAVGSADFVVGNPPYIRLEEVPRPVMERYRRECPTMKGRSDIYVGFLEKGLRLLATGGKLGFICADRWMRNQYGAGLRELISKMYAVDVVVTMHDVDAFENDVSAYPAIVVLRNGSQASVNVVDTREGFGPRDAAATSRWAAKRSTQLTSDSAEGARVGRWFDGSLSWPAGNPARQALVSDLERRFPPLEDGSTGTRVGIGVATGCDEIYITTDPKVVEQERLLPLMLARDTSKGLAKWSGHYLVNPWTAHGLVDLGQYPLLRRYFETHEERLRGRHIAKSRPDSWYRTIDRVDEDLRSRPKLLLPDMKGRANPVLDSGRLYPHPNLYYVVSEDWDLEVLGALLLSDIANAVIGAYCVKMRGGTYRFQAQYIRRMRVPDPASIDPRTKRGLATAFRTRDRESATQLAAEVYEINVAHLAAALQ